MDLQRLKIEALSMGIFSNLFLKPPVSDVLRLLDAEMLPEICAAWGAYYGTLVKNNAVDEVVHYFKETVLGDANAYSAMVLKGGKISSGITAEVTRELAILENLARLSPEDIISEFSWDDYDTLVKELPRWKSGSDKFPTAAQLEHSFITNGSGDCYNTFAFTYDCENKRLNPVKELHPVTLCDLKEYKEEKEAIIDNTESFIEGLPANNVLLYGDRGTGKSSTVHAILNEYKSKGLRLVEMDKEAIGDFPLIMELLRAYNNKFIIFIDDLTFADGGADNYAKLKAALEGSVSKLDNVLIYATTNRRHLLKESHSDRQGDDLHRKDTMEEQMSLSDRFGLVITFINPDKEEFCGILRQILEDRKVLVTEDKLRLLAERYAIKKGGRSPRGARQLADMIESKFKRNLDINLFF